MDLLYVIPWICSVLELILILLLLRMARSLATAYSELTENSLETIRFYGKIITDNIIFVKKNEDKEESE